MMLNSWPIDVPSRQEVIAKLKIYELMLIVLFGGLSILTSYLLWTIVGWRVVAQVSIIMIVGAIGEHYISGQGYYYYTKSKHNGFFVGRVPLWIPFMWVFVVQGAFIIPLMLEISIIAAIITSGLLCFLLDLIVIEPVLSRERSLWAWTPVEKGYLGFLPSQLDRFTAPPGNYLVWFIFPVVTNTVLYGLMIFFIG
jgi:hypothetical protein